MTRKQKNPATKRNDENHRMKTELLNNYGMLLVLVGLIGLFSVLTLERKVPTGRNAIDEVVQEVDNRCEKSDTILVIGAAGKPSAPFAKNVGNVLKQQGFRNTQVVVGIPRDVRVALNSIREGEGTLAAVVSNGDVANRVIDAIPEDFPEFEGLQVVALEKRLQSVFLKPGNLLAIVNRIVVIAVIAIGMTMVIITAGIDLSVGSLIALSAVVATLFMKKMGGLDAPSWTIPVGFLLGTLVCGLLGATAGMIIAWSRVAAFIMTLTFMMVARGLARILTNEYSIYQVPDGLPWLGRGHSLGIPNTVILLVILYAIAHIFMSRTRLARYIYAVGGNEEAARLSGVPVKLVIVFVYTVSGLAAGLGGCILASRIGSGSPAIGKMFELYVIAAVVVGGTSLFGGSGKILGTLIGAFIISVIQNGMNSLHLGDPQQLVVLGTVILGATLLDKFRSSGGLFKLLRRVGECSGRTKVALATLCVIALTAAILPFARSKPDDSLIPKTRGTIGVTCSNLANPFFKLIAEVMEDEARKHGYAVLSRSADQDPARQNTQIADFVAQECDAVFLNPIDSQAVGQAVKDAHDAGIPVFTYDIQVSAKGAVDLIVSHIGSDNFQGGRLAGESMMKATGDTGEIALITYPEATSGVLRVDGFKDYLKEHNSRLKIVAELAAEGDRPSGLNVATDILQTHPGIVGIFAINDPAGLGAYSAIASEGKTDQITIIGFDASPAGKQAVFEKKLYDTPQQYPRKMASGTVGAFIKYLDGEDVSKQTFLPCTHYYYEDSANDESRVKEQW